MAEPSTLPSNTSPPSESQKKRAKRKPKGRSSPSDEDANSGAVDSLHWNESFAGDDPFLVFAGGDEGGFLSLEEIDESEYGLIGGIQDLDGMDKKKKKEAKSLKSKKRKRGKGDGDSGEDDSSVIDAVVEGEVEAEQKKTKKKRKNKKNKKKKGKKETNGEANENDREIKGEPALVDENNEDALQDANDINAHTTDNLILEEDDVHAWNELRLHPCLIKSIRRLGFKEPTAIQKACIPAAAHQGKDIIGAAETGSGKTLAFALPILQRFLEEHEKDARLLQEDKSSSGNVSRQGFLRALIVTPTRELALQVSDHIREAAKFLEIQIVSIVGGMSSEKQERLLKRRPQIVVGTPGRLWELMSMGNEHLVELHSLSFFVLDEADRMIETGHFHELQSIIDMLPMRNGTPEQSSQNSAVCKTVPTLQRKKRQTFVFSATIALSDNFRKKLKRGLSNSKSLTSDGVRSIETLVERAGMRPDAAVFDLTNATILAHKLEESFLDCSEEDKEAYLYYILSIHGQGRTIVFCTSIAALRRVSSILRILDINVWTLHAQMQQRARLKAIDRFRGNEHAVLIATDVAARGLDIPGIRTVVHYQLPHSAEVYIHRSGRTARAAADGCCIALISPSDKTKFMSLCKSLSRESLRQFPVDNAYMPEVLKRVSLARQVDKIQRKASQETAKESWLKRNAESLGFNSDENESEDEKANEYKQKNLSSLQLKKLQQELNDHLKRPLQPKTLSHRYLAGSGVSLLLQQQLQELSKRNSIGMPKSKQDKKARFVVIGQDCIEPLQALRNSGNEVSVNLNKEREMRKLAETRKRKRQEDKRRTRDTVRRNKKNAQEGAH